MALFLADLQFAFVKDFEDDFVEGGFGAEGFGEVGGGGRLAFADVEEDGGDLEDVVEVFFGAGAVFKSLVFVAGDFEAFAALFEAYEGNVCEADLVGGLGVV